MKDQKYFEIYFFAKYIRKIETAIANHYDFSDIRCPIHLSIGQELVAASFSEVFEIEDQVFSSHRSHAHYFAKNGNLEKFIHEIHGKIDGCSSGLGGSMHLIDLSANFLGSTAIVSNSIPIAVGAALGNKINRSKHLVFSFFGDAATEEGVFFESLNFASLKKLPMVFVCENNSKSVNTDISERQPSDRNNCAIAKSLGIKAYRLNERNPIIFIEELISLMAEVRDTLEPTYVEIDTSLMVEHCGPRYEIDLEKDPLEILRKKLLEKDIKKMQSLDESLKLIDHELLSAFDSAHLSNYISMREASEFVYAKN